MSTKNILRIGLLFICCCFCFLAEANVRNRGYVLILNSYAETDVWANYAIDSIRKNHSIKENIYVESLDILLEDSVLAFGKEGSIFWRNMIQFPVVLSCWGTVYGVYSRICLRGLGKMSPLFFAYGKTM